MQDNLEQAVNQQASELQLEILLFRRTVRFLLRLRVRLVELWRVQMAPDSRLWYELFREVERQLQQAVEELLRGAPPEILAAEVWAAGLDVFDQLERLGFGEEEIASLLPADALREWFLDWQSFQDSWEIELRYLPDPADWAR